MYICQFEYNNCKDIINLLCSWITVFQIDNFQSSSPVISNCNFSGNHADQLGGGMYIQDATPSIINSVFNNNSSTIMGGGMIIKECSPNITNCTFSQNTASSKGGGIHLSFDSYPAIVNTIIWGNSALGEGDNVFNFNISDPTFSYCNIEGSGGSSSWDSAFGTDGSNNIDSKPFFVGSGDHPYLIYGISLCADAGDNSANAETTDIRGGSYGRKLSKVDGSAGTIDIGAYEYKYGVDAIGEYPPIYVDGTAAGSNNGSSWANAYTSFQSALDVAISGQEIWVAKGTYKPSYAYDLTNTSRYFHFRMIDGVEIYGGFTGTETATSQRTDYGSGETNETTLSGDFNGDDIVSGSGLTLSIGNNTENSYHVFYHPNGMNLTSSAVLDGFTVTGGNADGSGWHPFGGGAFNYGSSPSYNHCTFIGNSANEYGGGMYNRNSSAPTVTNCTFSKNSGKYGGGIYNLEASPSITSCDFTGNKTSFFGAGIANYSLSSPSVTSCEFSDNYGFHGGGMYNRESTPTVTNCIFINNSAGSNGGGMYIILCSPTLVNCAFSQNSSSDKGGGIFLIFSSSAPSISNTILWDNTASSGNEIYNDNSSNPTFSYCDIEGSGGSSSWVCATLGTDGGSNIDSDPLFV
ncbi:MAG: hypothetical protein DRJ05_08985, partial [Bacteroidetes bacterium]